MSFLCIACGKDLTYLYKDRRSFSEDSKGAAEPRKQALSSWIEVMEKELIIYQKSFSAIFPHPSEAICYISNFFFNSSVTSNNTQEKKEKSW